MKVTQENRSFRPVTIVIETQKELDDFNWCLRKAFHAADGDSAQEALADDILNKTDPEWGK